MFWLCLLPRRQPRVHKHQAGCLLLPPSDRRQLAGARAAPCANSLRGCSRHCCAHQHAFDGTPISTTTHRCVTGPALSTSVLQLAAAAGGVIAGPPVAVGDKVRGGEHGTYGRCRSCGMTNGCGWITSALLFPFTGGLHRLEGAGSAVCHVGHRVLQRDQIVLEVPGGLFALL